jgi:putative molybdopterin biosynthesis protein
VTVRLAQPLVSDPGFDEFVPVFVGRIGTTLFGTPHGKGAGVQMATVRANGYTHIPAMVEGLDAGTELEVLLTTDPGSIERTLILTGSLDPSLEQLASLVHDEGLYIHATNLGNSGALLALLRNACHAAPLSLPAQSLLSTYQPVSKYVPNEDVVFVHIATIEQGIASRNDMDLEDITRVRFINTKKETPARVVLDAVLADHDIDPSRVNGYRQEVYGPRAVAAAIRNGFADAGMCTSSVASASGLRFLPIAHEDYELAIRRDMLEDQRIRTLVSLIRSPAYSAVLKKAGGYDYTLTGTIRSLNGKKILTPLSPSNLPAEYS